MGLGLLRSPQLPPTTRVIQLLGRHRGPGAGTGPETGAGTSAVSVRASAVPLHTVHCLHASSALRCCGHGLTACRPLFLFPLPDKGVLQAYPLPQCPTNALSNEHFRSDCEISCSPHALLFASPVPASLPCPPPPPPPSPPPLHPLVRPCAQDTPQLTDLTLNLACNLDLLDHGLGVLVGALASHSFTKLHLGLCGTQAGTQSGMQALVRLEHATKLTTFHLGLEIAGMVVGEDFALPPIGVLAKLPSLTSLSLNLCSALCGRRYATPAVKVLAGLRHAPGLTYLQLRLAGNQLTTAAVASLATFWEAPVLETLHLDLQECSLLVGDVWPLTSLRCSTSLTELHINLRTNSIGDIDMCTLASLHNMPRLKHLNLEVPCHLSPSTYS